MSLYITLAFHYQVNKQESQKWNKSEETSEEIRINVGKAAAGKTNKPAS